MLLFGVGITNIGITNNGNLFQTAPKTCQSVRAVFGAAAKVWMRVAPNSFHPFTFP
jgi:hypothetical protein